jgi:hypothetical protein
MAEVSQQMFLGNEQVFGFYDNKWSGINSYEQAPPPFIQVRNDAFSSSLQLAMPYSNFSELGMSSYTQSLDGLIRTGNQANSYQIRATGSAEFLYPSASTVSFSASLWSDEAYTSSLAIQNAQNAGTYIAELGSNSFVVEFFINVQAASFTTPPFHRHIFGQNAGDNLTIQYSSTPQFRFYVNGDNSWSTTPNFNLGFSNQNWKHVAIVKSGTNVYVYVNGTRIGVGTRAATINSGQANQFILGTNSNNDGLFSLIQDYRVYVGTDKGYTGATITVPSSIVELT